MASDWLATVLPANQNQDLKVLLNNAGPMNAD